MEVLNEVEFFIFIERKLGMDWSIKNGFAMIGRLFTLRLFLIKHYDVFKSVVTYLNKCIVEVTKDV